MTTDNEQASFTLYVPSRHSYLRLGAPDPAQEDTFSKGQELQNGTGTNAGTWQAGGLLYSTGPIRIVSSSDQVATSAPAITDWSGDKLTGVHDGRQLFSISHVQAGVIPYFNGPSTTTFQRTDTYTNTLGTTQTFTTGQTLSYANGFIATAAIGGSMRASAGSTSNLFLGQVINFTKNGAELSGDFAYRSVKTQAIAVGSSLRLSANPLNLGSTTAGEALLTNMGRVIGIIGGLVGATSLAWDSILMTSFAVGDPEADKSDLLKQEMNAMRISLQVATALVDIIQAAAIAYGLVLRIQKAAAPVSDALASVLKLTSDEVVIKGVGGYIRITPTGISISGLAIRYYGPTNNAGPVPLPPPLGL